MIKVYRQAGYQSRSVVVYAANGGGAAPPPVPGDHIDSTHGGI